jgi:hypothetical protein
LPNLRAAVRSLQTQTVKPEIIVVVGKDTRLYKEATTMPVDSVEPWRYPCTEPWR